MSNSLYNPFLFSAFLDRRTFKNDEPSSNNDDDDGPSPAPAPTTFYNDYSDPDSPVLDTMSAVEDRRRGDGSTSSEYALANDKNFTPAPAVVEKSFGDTFAENRAAGNETFVYNGNLYTTELASEAPVNEVRTLPSGTEYYVDASGQFAGLVPDSTPASSVSYDAFGNAYDTPAAAAQADQVAEAQSASAQNAITSASNAALDPRGDQIQSPTSNGAGIASLGEDDVMSQPVVTSASQEYLDSLPDFSYDFTADDAGSPLPGDNVVADLSGYGNLSQADFVREADAVGYLPVVDTTPYYDAFGNEYGSKTGAALADIVAENATAGGYAGMSQADFVREADAVGYLPVVDATPSYDAFGNAYPTAEQAAQADIDANNAAVMANNPDFVPQFPGDVPEGIISSSADIAPEQGLSGSDLLKYTAIGLPDMAGEMLTGLGQNLNLTSPLNTLQGFNQQNVGLMSLPIALTNRILEFGMSPEEKQRRIFAAPVDRTPSSISKALTDSGDFLSNTVSPYISNFLNPGSQQGVFEGDFGDKVSVTGVDGTNLTGTTAVQGIADTVAAEGVADVAVDRVLGKTLPTRIASGVLNAGEQLTGFQSDVSAQVDNAYVSGALDDNQVFKDALAAQNGDVDNALAAVKNLVYSDGYAKIAASGAVDAVIPGPKSGFVGMAKDAATRGGVEMGQGAYEGYQAISSINNVLGTDFDPTKNIVGNALTEGIAGAGGSTVSSGVNALSARQRRNAADEAAVMGQPVIAPYGGMDTSGITPGFKQPRSPSSAGSPGTIEGQFTVYDPNLSPTAGEPASSTVSTAYDLEGPEAGLALTDQRDPMTTSMEAMAAQEIINDQVNQTGTVDFGILQRIQNATGLSMNELGTMVESATSTKLTPDQIAAIESAPVGDVMTNAPVAPGFDDEVTGNFGGSNISVRPNPDGTTTLTAPSGRISVVEPGQDLDQAIKVFDEIVTPIDVQTDAPVLQSSGQGLAAPDFTAAPFASTNIGGLSSLGLPSGADLTPAVDTSSGRDVITNKMDADNTFAEVSDAQAVANAEAIKAQEVAYTETKAATGSDSAAEAAGEAAYNSSIAASSVTETDDGGAKVEIADNLFEAANKADQDVVTVNADGTATVAVDPNAVETGTDVAVVPETTTDVTTNADGTTDVVVDGTTDLTTAATTDLTVDGDTDTDTDTTAVTVVDNTIDGTATEISGAITDQTTDNDTSPKVVVVPDTKVLTEVEPPEEEVQVDVEDEVQEPGGDVTVDLDEDDTFVPVITSIDENGETITECPEGYVMVEGPDGPMCQKSVTATRQRAGASTRAYTGLAGNIGRTGPGQRRKTTTLTERVRPTVRSA
jgi:hypothetical protein